MSISIINNILCSDQSDQWRWQWWWRHNILYYITSYTILAAARLLCGTSARTHAPPLLKQLHWLPVSSRIQFKLCTLMFDINHGTAPEYLSELVRRCDDTRLRSNVRGNFVVSRTQLHVTNKTFSIAGPRAWNALPSDIKLISTLTSFRKRLNTHFLVASSLNFY